MGINSVGYSPINFYDNKISKNSKKLSFSQNKSTASDKTTQKALLYTGLGALAALGIYLATKGKKAIKLNNLGNKPIENVVNNTNEMANSVQSKIDDVIKQFKETNVDHYIDIRHCTDDIKNVEPTITKLKNGKYKLEFVYQSKTKNTYNDVLILDNMGNFEKRIVFNKYPDVNGNKGLALYDVFDGINQLQANRIKSYKALTGKNGKRTIELEKQGGWKNRINIKSSDDATLVMNNGWSKRGEETPAFVATAIIKKDGKPTEAFRSISKDSGNTIEDIGYHYKLDGTKTQVDDIFKVMTEEQNLAVRKFFEVKTQA